MQYESIILELMTRLKKLEDEVADLKKTIERMQTSKPVPEFPSAPSPDEFAPPRSGNPYTKTTDEMIDTCYVYGKMAHETNSQDLWTYADMAARESGMNRNSAFMYISAVKCMLEGAVYKRAINARATERYLSNILNEFGPSGLHNALSAIQQHLNYRRMLNHPVDSIASIYNRYSNKL